MDNDFERVPTKFYVTAGNGDVYILSYDLKKLEPFRPLRIFYTSDYKMAVRVRDDIWEPRLLSCAATSPRAAKKMSRKYLAKCNRFIRCLRVIKLGE